MMPPVELESIHSSFRENMLEHVFIAELQQEAWFRRWTTMEILRSEVDDSGYDIVAECDGVVRYIQLKASRPEAKVSFQKVNISLAEKPGGCVVWMQYEEDRARPNRVALGYLYFGRAVGQTLPSLEGFKTATHTKANAKGVKAERPAIREIRKSQFERIETAEALMVKLFGASRP